ncbi:type II secretion system F family protein [soil metagenome]
MAEPARYSYAALDQAGRRTKGEIFATSAEAAFETLKAQNLTPVRIRAVKTLAGGATLSGGRRLNDREIAGFVSDLGALLHAGADMRSALSIIGPKSGAPALEMLTRQISTEISGGGAIDQAFVRHLPQRHAYVAALVSAGEASGDLAGGLERAAEMLESRLKARDQLVSILAYPVFVLVSAIIGLAVILLFVIPSLGPLANAPGAHPGIAMRTLLGASTHLRAGLPFVGLTAIVLAVAAVAGAALGVWGSLFDRLLLRGPLNKLAGALVYGGFAVSLGGILAAGAPISEALRLAIRTTRSGGAQKALEPVLRAVRSGQTLSTALGEVRGFPPAIVRLTVIGEQSGALGPMLVRAGRFEEAAAFRTIETTGQILGPALIVALGGLIGLLMAGLLSGVSGLGDGALQ